MERETGIEPASLAWKARVLPLNYSRIDQQLCTLGAATGCCLFTGGGDWIRTSVGVSQQIYSLPPLATRAPLRRISNYSTTLIIFRKGIKICGKKHPKLITGAAGGDRTHDPWLRRPILYPLSYSRIALSSHSFTLSHAGNARTTTNPGAPPKATLPPLPPGQHKPQTHQERIRADPPYIDQIAHASIENPVADQPIKQGMEANSRIRWCHGQNNLL